MSQLSDPFSSYRCTHVFRCAYMYKQVTFVTVTSRSRYTQISHFMKASLLFPVTQCQLILLYALERQRNLIENCDRPPKRVRASCRSHRQHREFVKGCNVVFRVSCCLIKVTMGQPLTTSFYGVSRYFANLATLSGMA